MILKDIQAYIAQQGKVTLADLVLHFAIEANALRPMLHRLVRKGRVRYWPSQGKCQGCTRCDIASLEMYEWIL